MHNSGKRKQPDKKEKKREREREKTILIKYSFGKFYVYSEIFVVAVLPFSSHALCAATAHIR